MKQCAFIAAAGLAASAATAQVTVEIGQSDAPWLAFMNVFELPAPGDETGAFVFGSGWGVNDLVSSFDDGAQTLTMFPNQIGDPNEFWYQEAPGGDPGDPNNGGPGAPGNKIMEGNLFQEINAFSADSISGELVTFEGTLLSDTFTEAHRVRVFIRDFAADFSSVNETIVELTSPGDFSISLLTTDDGTDRKVQWGIQVTGVNVWNTDAAPFGNAVFATIPAPGAACLLALGGLAAARRHR